jgi:hypothetical protein
LICEAVREGTPPELVYIRAIKREASTKGIYLVAKKMALARFVRLLQTNSTSSGNVMI